MFKVQTELFKRTNGGSADKHGLDEGALASFPVYSQFYRFLFMFFAWISLFKTCPGVPKCLRGSGDPCWCVREEDGPKEMDQDAKRSLMRTMK